MDTRLISYLYYFNIETDYFECHEYGEHLWLEEGRPVVLKGFIQAAVCLYHLYNGNVKGGAAMWMRAKTYLHDARPIYQGIDVESLIHDIDAVWGLVPATWGGTIVAVEAVEQLHLPKVMVHILDSHVLSQLPSHQPETLTHA